MLASSIKKCTIWDQWVGRQLHQSQMDNLLPRRIATPTFDYFLGRHIWIGTVDNQHSQLLTGGRYSFPWRALSCIVVLVGACLPWCCSHACFCCGICVDFQGGGFFYLDWRVECDCCRLQAMRHKIGMMLISFSMCTHDTADNMMSHILWCR